METIIKRNLQQANVFFITFSALSSTKGMDIKMRKYIIYGTGSIAEKRFNEIAKQHGQEVVECFIDSMLSKKKFCGKDVIHPSQLKEKDINSYTYVLGTLTSKKGMINELKNQGVNDENILIEKDYGSNSFEENIKSISSIYIYPPINKPSVLKELDEQFDMLVPNLKDCGIKAEVISESKVKLTNLFPVNGIDSITKYDLILVWDKSRLEDEVLHLNENVYCIDPEFFIFIDIRILLRINYVLEGAGERQKYIAASKNNYKQFVKKYKGNVAYVFGTGPSCEEGAMINYEEASVRVVCNGMIYNNELMEKIKPNVYAIADENFMTINCKQWIDNIYTYISENDCIFIVPNILGAVLIKRYPELINKLVRVSCDTNKINFPSEYNLSVYRKAYNVITLIAIPVASYISNKIYIMGCDGIKQLEDNMFGNTYWAHEEKVNFEQQNPNIMNLFEGDKENEEEYYLKHICYFTEILEYGERLGKEYISCATSYIPALQKRSKDNVELK